jgi:hypothetical protein
MARCRPLSFVFALLAIGLASAAGAQDLPRWFDAGASVRANAANAARDGAPAGDATDVLIGVGDDAPHVVAAVVEAYDRCDAVYDSVRAAVRRTPGRAGDIVQAAASGGRCPCTGEAIWQRSRLEARIRIEQRRDPLLVAPLCGCAATSAEAAVAAAPDRADEVLEAALNAGRRAVAVVDALGQVGSDKGPGAGAAESLVRVPERRCERDAAADDRFELGQLWQAASLDPGELSPRACEDGKGDDDEEADESSDLALAGYLASRGDRVLVLHNGTDRAVDLAQSNYQVELFFPGRNEAGRRVPLVGTVAAGDYHVVAGREAADAWLAHADQVVPGGLLVPSEAVVLRRGLDRDGCECALAGVAGTVNGLGPAGRDWLAEQAGAGRDLATADRVGQVRPETFAADQWRSPLAPAPLALGRVPGECMAERRPEAPFILGTPWQETLSPPQVPGDRCAATPTSVLLASIQAWPAPPETQDQPPARSVRLFNGTTAPVDLAREGYVLEVYAGGSRDPVRVVKLEGEIARGASATVVSGRVPEAEREGAIEVTEDLAQRELDAVVLRRIATSAGGVCRADVYAAAVEVGPAPIVIAASPDPLAEGEPRTDESPIDPDRGGDVVSPN